MSAHKYWRIYVTANNGNANSIITKLELRGTIGGADQCTGGSATASSYVGGWNPSGAFDNDPGTGWAPNSFYGWLQYTFASPVEVAEYAVQCRNTVDGTAPKSWVLKYSDDGYAWTIVDHRYNQTGWTASEMRTFNNFSFDPTVACLWRLDVYSNNGNANLLIPEIELKSSAGGSDLCSGGIAAANDYVGGWPPANAFDDNITTGWAPSASFGWIFYALATPANIVEYTVRCRNTVDGTAPKSWLLEYSYDAFDWIPVDTRINQTGWTASEVRTYSIQPLEKRIWRLYITETNGFDATNIGEMELRATVGGADQCTGSLGSASRIVSTSYSGAKAFDDDVNTCWASPVGFTENGGEWLAYVFPSAVDVGEYLLRVRTDGSYASQAPKTFRLEFLNNSNQWVTVDSRAEQTGWAAGEARVFIAVPPPIATGPTKSGIFGKLFLQDNFAHNIGVFGRVLLQNNNHRKQGIFGAVRLLNGNDIIQGIFGKVLLKNTNTRRQGFFGRIELRGKMVYVSPGDMAIEWRSRNRHLVNCDRYDYTIVPEDPEFLQFRLQFWDATIIDGPMLREVLTTNKNSTYTTAQQTADGGPKSMYRVRLRQENSNAFGPWEEFFIKVVN